LAHQRTVQEALVAVATVELETLKALSLADLVRKRALGQLAWIRAVGNRLYIAGEHALSTAQQWFSFPLFRINERPVSLLHILRSLLILFFAFFFSSQLQKGLRQWSRPKRHISNASLYAFNRVAHYSIVCIGVIWALSALGMEFQNLFILAGALSVGIGFGLQGIANNFLSGLIVLFDRKLRVGDFIELADGAAGHITEVNVQNTVVRTRDGYEILVPNSDILTRQLTNWTLRDYFIRVRIPFGVAYGSDKERVVEVVEAAARRVDSTILDHKKVSDPRCRLIGFGNNSLDFELRVWVDFRQSESARGALRSSYCWEIDDALREAGIEIPFPQLDLHLRSGFKTDG
jgi:small-conductance mechanosensitive channel